MHTHKVCITKPTMRTYQPAWNQLKKEGKITISAPSRLHRRIYKAIIKEKWLDSVYHLEHDFNGYTTRLSKTRDGNALTITLHVEPTLEILFK